MSSIDDLATQWRTAQRLAREVGGRTLIREADRCRRALAAAAKRRAA